MHTLVDGSEGFELMNGDGSVHLPTYFGFAALARYGVRLGGASVYG